jgi:AcrR family transcriptional regulator
MVGSPARKPRRKRPDRYHHGDLQKALLQEAVRTIQAQGVERLTLRGIGESLGVSRTALYRHFSDKSALLAEVASQGFRLLRESLLRAWEAGGRDREGLDAMGVAYVRFALQNPSHYRVMFGGFLGSKGPPGTLAMEGRAAFHVLVDALVAQQKEGLVRQDDPLHVAHFVWATVHGISMLAIDGMLGKTSDAEEMARYANGRIRAAIAAASEDDPRGSMAAR